MCHRVVQTLSLRQSTTFYMAPIWPPYGPMAPYSPIYILLFGDHPDRISRLRRPCSHTPCSRTPCRHALKVRAAPLALVSVFPCQMFLFPYGGRSGDRSYVHGDEPDRSTSTVRSFMRSESIISQARDERSRSASSILEDLHF